MSKRKERASVTFKLEETAAAVPNTSNVSLVSAQQVRKGSSLLSIPAILLKRENDFVPALDGYVDDDSDSLDYNTSAIHIADEDEKEWEPVSSMSMIENEYVPIPTLEEIMSRKKLATDTDSILSLYIDEFMAPEEISVEEESSTTSADTDRTVVEYNDLLQNLTNIPDIGDIELSISSLSSERLISSSDSVGSFSNKGVFVDPLTGKRLSIAMSRSTIDSRYSDLRKSSIKEKTERHSRASSAVSRITLPTPNEDIEIIEDEDVLKVLDMEEEEIQIQVEEKPEIDEAHAFRTSVLIKGVKMSEANLLEALRQLEEEKLVMHTLEFLEALIAVVVTISTENEKDQELNKKMDRAKLWASIRNGVDELQAEQKTRTFLNARVVDYYRRKKIFRYLLEENKRTEDLNSKRYKEYLTQLDKLISKEEDIKNTSNDKIEQLMQTLEAEKARAVEHKLKLKELFTQTFEQTTCSERMLMHVKNSLAKMKTKAEEISKMRAKMILKQHKHTDCVNKLRTLQDLGNGLTLKDYESINREIYILDKKLEERNSDFEKKRRICSKNCHITAHIKDREQIVLAQLQSQKLNLKILQKQQYDLKRRVYLAKIEHSHLRRELKEASFQSGLLDKPELMYDFDDTIAAIEDAKTRVHRLKMTLEDLQTKVNEGLKKCSKQVSERINS